MIWLALLLCLAVSFLFSGIESGVLSVNRVRLRHYARSGEEAAQKLDLLLLRIERLMITVVLITNAANIAAVTLLYTILTKWLGPVGALVSLLVALPLLFVLEFLSKAIFRRFPYRTLVGFARILTVAHWLVAPAVNLAAWVARPIFRASREAVSGRIVAVEDLQRLLSQEGGADGTLGPVERAVLGNVIDFRPLLSGDLMQPLDSVPKVEPGLPVSGLLRQAAETGDEQFLVMQEDGGVGGLVRVTDLLLDGVGTGRVQSYVRRVVIVSANDQALETLRKLRAARMPLAVVLDSSQKAVGVLSSERLVRRLLGGGK
jgi:putative hemolysin